MLEIYGNNEKFDLPDDIEVDLTFENPFLSQERIPFTYSMSINLPASDNNVKKFKHPKRLNSVGSWANMSGYFRFNGIRFSQGTLNLTEAEKNLSVNYVGIVVSALFKKMLSLISGLTDLFYSFGEGSRLNPDFNLGWAKTYKDTIDASSKDIGTTFSACPVRVKSEEWFGLASTNGIRNMMTMYMNMWNVNNGSYLFTDYVQPMHGVIFPQPYVHYLISEVLGSTLNENFFAGNDELKSLCMITSYHKLYSYSNMSNYRGILIDNTDDYVYDNYMYMPSFFNSHAFNDFLKELLKIFCCSLLPTLDGKFDIIHNQVILDGTDVEDWSDKLVGIPTISMEKGKRYDYGYQSESIGNVEELYPLLDNIDDLLSAAAGKYQIITTGEVFEKKLVDAVYTYERITSNLGGNSSEPGDDMESYSINSSVKPLPMAVDEYWYENIPTRAPWYVPEFPGDRKTNEGVPYIGFMRGFYDLVSKQIVTDPASYVSKYPFLSPYVRDMAGNKIGNYSLAWEGPDGLIAKFHPGFKAYWEKDKHILKGSFLLTELDLKNISYKKKYHVRGMKYYIRKIECTLKKKTISLSRIELIEV